MKYKSDLRILKLALPTILSQISLTLVQLVDMIFIGRLGPGYIAAVGVIFNVLWVVNSIGHGWGIGLTACIARMEGAKDYRSLRIFFRTGLLSITGISLFFVPFLFVFRNHLFLLINTPGDILSLCEDYFLALLGFLPFSFTFVNLNDYFRARGDSFTPMIAGIGINLINILLDWILIFGNLGFPAMGITGAGLASGFSCFSGSLVLFIRSKNEFLHIDQAGDFFRFHFLKKIIKFANSAIIERMTMSLSQLGVMVFTVNHMGSPSIAAFNIVMRLASLSFMPGFGFAISASALSGQSLGEKKPAMARGYILRSTLYCGIIMFIISLLYYFFPDQLFHLFTDEPGVITLARDPLRVFALCAVFLSPTMVIGGGLRGAGDTHFVMYSLFFSRLLLRLPLAWLLGRVFGWGLTGVWFAICLDFISRGIIYIFRLRTEKWQTIVI